MSLYLVEDDTLYVRDGHLRWHVFSPKGEFVRSNSLGPIIGMMGYTLFMTDGRILGSYPKRSAPGRFQFHLATRDGKWLKGIAPVDSAGDRPLSERMITGGRDGTFWATSEAVSRWGYRLERWDTAGQLRDTIILDVPWVQPRPVLPDGSPTPFPRVAVLHLDSAGVLFVGLEVPKAGWRAGFDTMPVETQMRALDVRLDAIDATTGRLLATNQFEAQGQLPVGFFGSSRDGYRAVEDSQTGLITLSLITVQLGCESPGRL